jgi:hypothetical protein
MGEMMRAGRGPFSPARLRAQRVRPWLPALGAAGILLLLLTPVGAAVAPLTGWESEGVSWSNGLVLCQFAPSAPLVSVSAWARQGTGLTASVDSISEVRPAGTDVATTNLAAAAWTVTNLSTDATYDLSYSAEATVASPASPDVPLGTVGVRVDFVLPAYDHSASGTSDTVEVELLLSAWPWQASADHLVVTLAAAPSFPAAEHLVLGTTLSSLVSSLSTSSGSLFEQLTGSPTGIANPNSSASASVSAGAVVAGNSSLATVSLSFGTTAGSFASLSYTASVRVNFPSQIAGIPVVDFVVVGSAAILVSVLVAAGVRRVRRRPSDLTYANEEEP